MHENAYYFQYLKENINYQQALRKQLQLSDDIAMHSAVIHLSENANMILEESSTYPSNSFLSDTGGALGEMILRDQYFKIFRTFPWTEYPQYFTIRCNNLFFNSKVIHPRRCVHML